MVFHTGDARVRSRQPTRHSMGNGIPLPPNVPLSCADVRHSRVKVWTQHNLCIARNVGIGTIRDAWMNCCRVSANKANIEERAARAEQKAAPILVLHTDGQRSSVRISPVLGDYSSGYFGRGENHRGNWRAGAWPDGARAEGKASTAAVQTLDQDSSPGDVPSFLNASHAVEAVTPPAAVRQITTRTKGVGCGSRGEVQLHAFATRVHDKLSDVLGYHADTRLGRSAGARAGTSPLLRADLQSIGGGRSTAHTQDTQEAVTTLLAFLTFATAYAWAAAAWWLL